MLLVGARGNSEERDVTASPMESSPGGAASESRHLGQGGAELLVGEGVGAADRGVHDPEFLGHPLLELMLPPPNLHATQLPLLITLLSSPSHRIV
jgi:hypothetical protein